MNTLTANIQREWLARIIDGSKKIEYRDASEYWWNRLDKAGPPPFHLRLINGMKPDSPEATVLVDRADIDLLVGSIRLHIKEVVSTIRWDTAWHRDYPPLPTKASPDPTELLSGKLRSTKIVIDVSEQIFEVASTPGQHTLTANINMSFALKLNGAGPNPFKMKLRCDGKYLEVIAYELSWQPFDEVLSASVLKA